MRYCPIVVLAPKRKIPLCLACRVASSKVASWYKCKIWLAYLLRSSPAGVRKTVLPFRSNSRVPCCSSNSRMCFVTAGCVINNSPAALVKLRCWATLQNTFNRKSDTVRSNWVDASKLGNFSRFLRVSVLLISLDFTLKLAKCLHEGNRKRNFEFLKVCFATPHL